jgi:hypothetical protein
LPTCWSLQIDVHGFQPAQPQRRRIVIRAPHCDSFV